MSIYEKYPDLNDPGFVASYRFEDCYTKRNPQGAIVDLDVAVALLQSDGNVSDVASLLGRSRRAIDTYIARDVLLSDLAEDVYDEFMDEVETKMKSMARQGEKDLLKFVLSTKGKNRGYVARVENTGKNGGAMGVQFFMPENGRDQTSEDVITEDADSEFHG